MTTTTPQTHETEDDFLDAAHDDHLLVRAGGELWLGWETEDGDWYFCRPASEDDPLGPEGDRWRPVGPTPLSSLPFPVVVVHANEALEVGTDSIDETHLSRQRAWSETTFGPGARTRGVVDHIRKELREIEAAPDDLGEWVDVVILALDGAWRSGASPKQIIAAIRAKQARNESRTWPDWRTMSPDQAIEHVRTAEPGRG
ncbi:dATP/dGTP pyrophosphohydrolase domain-containing protein [Auraticoccus monumenti]|uniref:dATP/dGTP diphosphohydrolase MazZ domain-containing protein n=1 Tax=Auraticoccus monumenti TaxID=675864 RepID=A0A1G6UL80_9ACTN|nr:dATP/dGTP pyrophosphohydrolase domain-containing protein [Auraticoccus monumenti]SDD42063.1 Protein of unknown function [Auraticoccus monumenti]